MQTRDEIRLTTLAGDEDREALGCQVRRKSVLGAVASQCGERSVCLIAAV
ncbi:MAG: hypothetical protein M3354_08930 [Chloroflexota bacterium]|nr:hypothetical protein [Chloroflexota bacterium]